MSAASAAGRETRPAGPSASSAAPDVALSAMPRALSVASALTPAPRLNRHKRILTPLLPKSFPVQTDEHFLTVARYVERNPLRAGLVDRVPAWPWSGLSLRRRTGLTDEERELRQRLADWPVETPRQWARRVNQPQTPAELEAMRTCVQRGRPCGSPTWTERTAERLGLQTTLRPRGRPRHDES